MCICDLWDPVQRTDEQMCQGTSLLTESKGRTVVNSSIKISLESTIPSMDERTKEPLESRGLQGNLRSSSIYGVDKGQPTS